MSEILDVFKSPFRILEGVGPDAYNYWWARRQDMDAEFDNTDYGAIWWVESSRGYSEIVSAFNLDMLDFPWEIDIITGDLTSLSATLEER